MPYMPYFRNTIPLSCLQNKPKPQPQPEPAKQENFDQRVMDVLVKYLQQQAEKK